MLEVRALGDGSASLGAVASRLGLTRPDPHSALNDAWLTMQVFLWLNQCPFEPLRFSSVVDPGPANWRSAGAPPHPTRLTPGGFQLGLSSGRIEGASVLGQ